MKEANSPSFGLLYSRYWYLEYDSLFWIRWWRGLTPTPPGERSLAFFHFLVLESHY